MSVPYGYGQYWGQLFDLDGIDAGWHQLASTLGVGMLVAWAIMLAAVAIVVVLRSLATRKLPDEPRRRQPPVDIPGSSAAGEASGTRPQEQTRKAA